MSVAYKMVLPITSPAPTTNPHPGLSPKNTTLAAVLRTIAMLVANPFATLSACLTTAATRSPPSAWLTTTLHTRGENPCRRPCCRRRGYSGQRKIPEREKVRLETDSCRLRAQRLGELGLSLSWLPLLLEVVEVALIGLPGGGELKPAWPSTGVLCALTLAMGVGAGAAGPLRTYSNQPPASPLEMHAARMAASPTRGSCEPEAESAEGVEGLRVPESCTVATPMTSRSRLNHLVADRERRKKMTLKRAAVSSLSWYVVWYVAASAGAG